MQVKCAVKQPVRRIERCNMAFCNEWNTDSKSITPEWKLCDGKRTGELGLDRLVHQIGIATDWAWTDPYNGQHKSYAKDDGDN